MSTDDPQRNPDDAPTAHDSPQSEGSGESLDAAPPEEGVGELEEGVGELEEGAEEADENRPEKLSRLKRSLAWLKENRYRAGVIGLILILALFSGITLSLLGANASNEKRIQRAMEALQAGNLTKAREIATTIASESGETDKGPADAAFILGMTAADDAEAGWPDDRSSYTLAARYFDIAYPSGFPTKFELLGLKTYGKVLLWCDRFAQSRQVLEQALKIAKDAPEKNEIRYLLVENDLAAENPDLTEAVRQNKVYLKTKELTKPQRTDGTLQQLQLQTRQGQFKSSRTILASLPKTAAYSEKVYYAKGRLAMREAEADLAEGRKEVSDQIRAKLDEAINSFRHAQGHANESSPTVPKSQYLIGVCLEQLGENSAALRQWKQVCEFFPDSPEAVASQYRLAVLYFYEEAFEETPTKAINYFKQVTKALEEEGDVNPWLTKAELRENATNRIQAFRKEEKLSAALGLAEAITPLVSKRQAMRLLATLNQELGQKILDELNPNVGGEEQDLKRRQARRHFREASLFFTGLTKQEKTSRHYSDDLWQSAECAVKGSDFTGAVRAFNKYLNTEPEKRNAAALLGLGEAYLSLGKVDEAIDTLEQCIEFYPTDVATFHARLLAAGAWQEKGDPKQAERLLLENWAAAGITPKSLVWRETLYRLGELYHDTKRYNKAIQRLSDAVRRFPDDPRTNLARYLLADSYRLRANGAQIRIEKTMTRSKLSAQKANIESDFNASHRQYMMLQQRIGAQRGIVELSEMDSRLLRNSRLFAAGVLFQLKQYRQAIKNYSTASLHYQGQPISIQTMKQNAQALANLNENSKAWHLIHRILTQLKKMGPKLPYEETTLYSYDEWMETLQQMEKEITMKRQVKGEG